MRTNEEVKYEEIRKMDHLLLQANIPHEFSSHSLGGFQITYFGTKGKPKDRTRNMGPGIGAICSAIETPFSYGHENDRIEISGLLKEEEYSPDNSVKGDLTAEDVFERIKAHWDKANQV